jgi:ABC-2 type transport system ATP-binding protein
LIVEINGLTKVYKSKPPVTAVSAIHLAIPRGGIFGLLGPNGAGKTTTISMCTTRVIPTSGSVVIAGVDVVKLPAVARRNIGVVTQYNTLDRACTVFENLYFHCRYFGYSTTEAKRRTNSLLEQFLLQDKASAYPAQLSGGLAQRLQIARAIAHRPAVLFLDEPSAGLDPQSRIAMWDAVRQLHTEGITVVLTTHYMEEADELCEQLAIMDHGKILTCDTPENLKRSLGAQTIYQLQMRDLTALDALAASIGGIPHVQSVEKTNEGLRVYAQASDGLLSSLVGAAAPAGLKDMRVSEPTLENVFIRLTGRDLRE